MNKVITINIGGTAFQLEDEGYDALRAYLDRARGQLADNPDREEILSDIEHSIAEKFRAQLSAYKNVVLTKEVTSVLEAMGPIADDASGSAAAEKATSESGAAQSTAGATSTDPGSTPKRLYCVKEGAMLAGVCNGIAAYLQIDPTFVRLGFVAATILWGTGLVVYVILALVIPDAETPAEKAAARGGPSTAKDFIRRAKAGYYEAVKSFPDRHARREWKRKFKREMRDWRHSFHHEWQGNADQWRSNWQQTFAVHPGIALALPLLSLLQGALLILWISAAISLLATGLVLGLALPAGLPVWGAFLILLFLYGLVAAPLKFARKAVYFGARAGAGPGTIFFFLMDAVVWVVLALAMVWLLFHFMPEAKEALRQLPAIVYDALDSIRDWWHRR